MEQKQMIQDNTWYSPLPWYKSIFYNLKSAVSNYIKNYKFPVKKVLILLVFALIVVGIYVAIVLNQVNVPARAPYDKTGFVAASAYRQEVGNQTVIENDQFRLIVNNQNTTFVLENKTTHEVYRSNPETTSARFLDTMVVYYAGSLGAATQMSVYGQAVAYDDFHFRVNGDTVEILYEVGGKKGVDRSDFPELLSDERMNDLILSKLEPGTTDYRRVTEQAYTLGELNGEQVWKLRDGIQTSILNQIYRIFYDVAGYTIEDLEFDLEMFGIAFVDIYSYFEIAISYTLTQEGLDIRLINEAIVEKEKFPLVYIDVLPYFAAATTTDEGYTFVPDGSGALIDFNNNRSFALAYNQRIYGREQAVIRPAMQAPREMIGLPLYGMNRNDNGFISIVEEGAEMTSIIANISTTDNPYNQAYLRYHFRENELFRFTGISNTTNIIQWTDWYNTVDLAVSVRFLEDNKASYSDMAKAFQEYLVEKEVLTLKDATNQVVLDLTLLGGYLVQDNFLGIPYETTRSLTNTKEAEEIIRKLLDDGVENINLIYKGWSNDGIKPTYMGNISFDSVTGTRSDFKALSSVMESLGVSFYPEVFAHTAYTSTNIRPNNDVVRNVFGKVVKNHDYIEAVLYYDPSTMAEYLLKPSLLEETMERILKAFTRTDFANIAFADLGNQMYGTYQKKETIMRPETLQLMKDTLQMSSEAFTNMLFRNPSMYVLEFATSITDVPTYATGYQIVGVSVPFYQLVLSGYLDYSGKSFNIDDKYSFDWHILKAMETASNISMTWSYHPTIDLTDTEYSYYYSTYYQNWYERVIEAIMQMNSIGIYETTLVGHEVLRIDGTLTKSIYANGMEIVFNYGLTDRTYDTYTVPSYGYTVVKEAS